MYITTGTSKHYAVLDTSIRADEVHYTLDEAPAELGASIKLWTADGGMCLRTDTVEDYAHPRIDGQTVVLSNTAPTEPEPKPEPVPTVDERITILEEQLVQADETSIALYEAQETQEAINAQQDEALMEIYEMLG